MIAREEKHALSFRFAWSVLRKGRRGPRRGGA
jgi:hypothetical protein